jgi:hypothetical protein
MYLLQVFVKNNHSIDMHRRYIFFPFYFVSYSLDEKNTIRAVDLNKSFILQFKILMYCEQILFM